MAKPQNLRRGNIGRISGSLIAEIDELKPGLGSKLVGEINKRLSVISTQLDAAAGHRGTVTIAKQKGTDAGGNPKPAIELQNDPVTGAAWAKQGSDAVPLDQFRNFFDCDWFLQMVEDCLDLPPSAPSGTIPDCWKA